MDCNVCKMLCVRCFSPRRRHQDNSKTRVTHCVCLFCCISSTASRTLLIQSLNDQVRLQTIVAQLVMSIHNLLTIRFFSST